MLIWVWSDRYKPFHTAASLLISQDSLGVPVHRAEFRAEEGIWLFQTSAAAWVILGWAVFSSDCFAPKRSAVSLSGRQRSLWARTGESGQRHSNPSNIYLVKKSLFPGGVSCLSFSVIRRWIFPMRCLKCPQAWSFDGISLAAGGGGGGGKASTRTQVHPSLFLQANTSIASSQHAKWKMQRWLFSAAEPQDSSPSWCHSASAYHGEPTPAFVLCCTGTGETLCKSEKLWAMDSWWETVENGKICSVGGYNWFSTAKQLHLMQTKGETLSRKWELKLFLKVPARCSCRVCFFLPHWAGCSTLFWNCLLLRGKKTQPASQNPSCFGKEVLVKAACSNWQ